MSKFVYAMPVLVPTRYIILITNDTHLYTISCNVVCVFFRVEGGMETGTLNETGICLPILICTVTKCRLTTASLVLISLTSNL